MFPDMSVNLHVRKDILQLRIELKNMLDIVLVDFASRIIICYLELVLGVTVALSYVLPASSTGIDDGKCDRESAHWHTWT